MKINSIQSRAYKTDLIFPLFEGKVTERPDYILVETPTNPTFIWGNFLLFPHAPLCGDKIRWTEIFKTDFKHLPEVKHLAFGWDGTNGFKGAAQEFFDDLYQAEESIVLEAQKINEPKLFDQSIVVRKVETDADWNAVIDNQSSIYGEHEVQGFRLFKIKQMKRYRAMAEKGLGQWFAIFDGKEAISDLGIFKTGNLGRFQTVGTREAWRRKGFASHLVYHSSRFAFEKMGVKNLIIVANEAGPAHHVYKSIGFKGREKQIGVCWWNREKID